MSINYIIDFDSTIVTIETLDELIALSLDDDPNKDSKVAEINRITNLGMAGQIGFDESLKRRMEAVSLNQDHLNKIIKQLSTSISPSALRNIEWFELNKNKIFVISGGFEEYIKPTIKLLGLDEAKVFANRFIFDGDNIIGFEANRFTAQAGGKPKQVNALGLDGKVVVIGDGHTDYEIKSGGAADEFWAFTESISRPNVTSVADRIVSSFDEIAR